MHKKIKNMHANMHENLAKYAQKYAQKNREICKKTQTSFKICKKNRKYALFI